MLRLQMTTEFILWTQLTGLQNDASISGGSITELQKQTTENTSAIATNTSNITELQNSLPITGTISMYAGDPQSVPNSWLVCDGSLQNKSDFPALATLLGTKYGDGSETQFQLPNLCGRMPIGVGTVNDGTDSVPYTLAQSGGKVNHTNSIEELAPHSHGLSANGLDALAGSGIGTLQPFLATPTAFTTTTGNAQPYSIMTPFLVINFIIKT